MSATDIPNTVAAFLRYSICGRVKVMVCLWLVLISTTLPLLFPGCQYRRLAGRACITCWTISFEIIIGI